ncbi:hypothetical protein C6503_24990 [Candidatus Poribacteria bacterium]|nr:MAG: hypothetical protein C6503_24990 [Candidatus Poribacteria bacterium]
MDGKQERRQLLAEHHEVRVTAEQNADADVSIVGWFVAGFALNVIGILIAYIYQPSPPIARLHDWSEEYTALYRYAYKTKIQRVQPTIAMIGCLVSLTLGIIIGCMI